VYLQAGRQLAVMGEWLLAGEAFRQAVQIRPDYAEAWAFLAEAHQQAAPAASQTSRTQALAELEQAHALSPQSAAVNSLLALYWQRQGDVDQMVFYLSAAAAAEPQNPVWQVDLGRALALQGDLVSARQHYEQAVQLAPQEALYWRLLGEFSLVYQVDLPDLGLPAMRRALALAPQDAAVFDVLGAAYLALENDPLAERFLLRALQADPGYAPAYLHLGVLNLYRSQAGQAQALLRQAEQLAGPGSEVAEQARQLLGDYFPR
jgi:Flp pilus assembly protein TadD